MSDIQAIFLNEGKRLVSGAMAGFSVYSVHSFKLGTSFGFDLDANATSVFGDTVFTGYFGLTQSKATAEDTVRHTIMLPEHVGPFTFGNMVVYGSHMDGTAIPFLQVVFPFPLNKIRSDPHIADQFATPIPGSRMVINIDIRHSISGVEAVVNVVSPDYASLPYYDTDANVPTAELNPWSQFIVNYDSRAKCPVLVSKKSDGTYWGVPLNQNYRHPKFGVMDGGIQGDGQIPNPYAIVAGQFYTTPSNEYVGELGGAPYEYSVTNDDVVIGGIPYSPGE